jgi:secondary thiamine-phosphate synthase enzyme
LPELNPEAAEKGSLFTPFIAKLAGGWMPHHFFPSPRHFPLQNFQGSDKVSPMNLFTVETQSRTDFLNIDPLVTKAVQAEGLTDGIVTIFIPHTTAGVTINENADPDVLADMEQVLDRVVPWDGRYRHFEGNTAAHVKASMMGSSVQVIVENGQLQLGTWQSLFLCEFDGPRTRNVWVKGI